MKKENKEIKTEKVEKRKTKKHSDWGDLFCTILLVVQIVLTLGVGAFALAPVLSAFFGVIAFFLFAVLIIITTVITLGTAWASPGFRGFWAGFWSLILKAFDGSDTIKAALSPYIVAILVPMFVASLSGFVMNLVHFIRCDHENKGRFITSCVFTGVAIINLVVGFVIYK